MNLKNLLAELFPASLCGGSGFGSATGAGTVALEDMNRRTWTDATGH